MTDFFQHQDAARRRTALLVVYFLLAVLGLVAFIYLLCWGVFTHGAGEPVALWQPGLLLLVSVGVTLVVGLASLAKVFELASGGKAVALMVGGKEIVGTSRQPRHRRLLNVVEEMAIAAGVPVPPVYVLDEAGINAFAAGYAPGDAVVAVSKGCLKYLTRDELQGVVAHEFSHILNGDMRLNIRLIGLIAGIMALSIIGRVLMEASGRSSTSSSSSSKKDSGAAILVLGLGLFLLGLVGAFFGRLIQAAVSRQREYLADASAVQFTRNPDGIAGALKKIGGLKEGSRIDNPRADEVSHMFIADAFFGRRYTDLLATHPPLDDRIRRLDPTFAGEYPEVTSVAVDREEELEGPKPGRIPPIVPGLPNLPGLPPAILAESAVQQVGRLTPNDIAHAQALHAAIPDLLRAAAQEPFGARPLVYALLLDPKQEVREIQVMRLKTEVPQADFAETLRLEPAVQSLPDALRLPLIDLAMPALRQMSPAQHQTFRRLVESLMSADQRLSLFEYTLRCVLQRHLDAQFGQRRPAAPVQNSPLTPADQLATVLSLLAWEGQPEPDQAAAAFDAGMCAYAGGNHPYRLPPRGECSLAGFDAALQALDQARPAVKRRVLTACAVCILADRNVTVREAELLRAIGDTLGCPLPPLVVEPTGLVA